MKIRALRGKVLVDDIQRGERAVGGNIILVNDNRKLAGIRARWCKVVAVGEGVTDVKVDEWLLVKHGNWTEGVNVCLNEADPEDITTIWELRYPEGVLAISDEPVGNTFGQESPVEEYRSQ